MDLFEALAKLKALRDAVKAGAWGKVLVATGELLILAGQVADGVVLTGATGDDAGESVDVVLADLEACCVPKVAAPGDDEKKTDLDPATILLIVKLVVEVFGMFRRKKQS